MLYLVTMYRSWSPLSKSTKISKHNKKKNKQTNKHNQFPCDVKYVKTIKSEKMGNLFLTMKIPGTSDFRRFVAEVFFRMNNLTLKN